MDILEELEPGVHQFWPMELYIKNEKIGDAYWLNICNRLDTMHRKLTYPFNERGFWKPTKDNPGRLVFEVQKIGEHHAWHDKFRGGTFISEEFAARLQAAGVTGLSYQHLEQA